MVTASSDACSIIEYTIVCRCLKVTAGEVQQAVERNGISTVREVARQTGAGSGCMACHCTLKKLIAERQGAQCPPSSSPICDCR